MEARVFQGPTNIPIQFSRKQDYMYKLYSAACLNKTLSKPITYLNLN